MRTKFVIPALLVLFSSICVGQTLQQKIENISQNKRAAVGTSLIFQKQVVTVGNEKHYPIMSVFKFHIALAVLSKMEKEGVSLQKQLLLKSELLQKDIWSPLVKKFPNQDILISYGELLNYMVSHSDNNACNWFIEYVGGIDKVDSYVRSLGINDFSLTETEKTMEADISKSYNNWSTPLAITQLLQKIYSGNVLSKEHFEFLEKAMLNSSSGMNKMKAGLPPHVEAAHKTGMSYRTREGKRMCDADVGVIYLPSGEKAYLAVLVMDSFEEDSVNAKIIADITNVVYQELKHK